MGGGKGDFWIINPFIMRNPDLELISLLNSIANVSERLAKLKSDDRFNKVSQAAKFMSLCKQANVEDTTMLLLMYSKGFLTEQQLNEMLAE